MIFFITTREHRYTIKRFLKRKSGAKVGIVSYGQLFSRRSLSPGTYIFTDHERLASWEQHLAAQIAHQLKQEGNGFRVLNDPARVKSRVECLMALNEVGINHFNVYRADEMPAPKRYPVFIRWESDHGLPLSGLIESETELHQRLEQLRNDGFPLRGMIIVEYMAQPLPGPKFLKYASYCIDGKVSANHIVTDEQWNVKYGNEDSGSDQDYEDEYQFVLGNYYFEQLQQVFRVASIDYGRADFGLVDGKVQVYEINTNPNIPLGRKDDPRRKKTMQLAMQNLFDSLDSVDTARNQAKRCKLSGPALSLYRCPQRYLAPFMCRRRP